jgi:hypothetical protein
MSTKSKCHDNNGSQFLTSSSVDVVEVEKERAGLHPKAGLADASSSNRPDISMLVQAEAIDSRSDDNNDYNNIDYNNIDYNNIDYNNIDYNNIDDDIDNNISIDHAALLSNHSLPDRLRHVLHGSDAIRAENINVCKNMSSVVGPGGCLDVCPSMQRYIRITTDDKRVLWSKDKCVIVQRGSGGIQEVFPNLRTAYYNIVQKKGISGV